eukprot:5674372-Amphidinium_carterae.1
MSWEQEQSQAEKMTLSVPLIRLSSQIAGVHDVHEHAFAALLTVQHFVSGSTGCPFLDGLVTGNLSGCSPFILLWRPSFIYGGGWSTCPHRFNCNALVASSSGVSVDQQRQHMPVQTIGGRPFYKSAYYGTLTIGTPAVSFKVAV